MKVYIQYDILETSVPEINPVAEFTMKTLMERNKYKVMWQLRSLEKEINDSEGMIIINQNGRIEAKNFNAELLDKILELLRLDEQ